MIPESAFGGGGSNDYNEEGVHDRARELSLLRSGSAPPTMEGAAFLDSGVSEVELRSDPAYRSYYYQNVKLNPRLPHPRPSKEGRSLAFGDGGGAHGGSESLFAMQPGFGSFEEEKVMQGEWDADGMIGYPGLGVGSKQKRIANMEGVGYPTTVSRRPSLMACQSVGEAESSETHVGFHHESAPLSALCSGTNMQSISSSISQSYASAIGASSGNLTPDLVRSPNPCISALSGDRMSALDQRYVNIHDLYNEISPEVVPSADIITSLSSLSLSGTMGDVMKYQKPRMQDRVDALSQRDNVPFKQYPYSNDSLKATSMPTLNCLGSSASHYLNNASPTFSTSNFGLGGYPASQSLMGNQVGDSRALSGGLPFESDLFVAAAELENYARLGNQSTVDALQVAHTDPSYLDYLISNGYSSVALDNQRMHVESLANPPVDFIGHRNAYFEASLRRSQYGLGFGKSSTMNNGFHGNYAFGLGLSHRGNHIRFPMFPNCPIASGGSDRNMEHMMCFPSTLRNMDHSFGGPWTSVPGCNLEESFAASLLDEFKGNKTRCLELAEIAGHVVEFSADQFGSRFIQQKLETASTQERNVIFLEIMPQALPLMTDVFGNYVIQKFLEHGSASQIRQLAEQLIGHVLTLSLQMYGCRVIQKALEVIELDQKKEMVAELDGHVLRCVRDQNGNHVIQKCIECVPENAIEFIVTTFYDQVVTLSTHPYGCRVIQRVLEHCDSPKTQAVVMDEIMNSVCMLAQDQYGNYVIQHVLGHGKPSERSAIIRQLIGKIVEMSQQKFASNVIEKCLSCGTHEERQALVHEMLGSTDENEPLQVMMKDQFANYVVQKVLETCSDHQLELLLNRIKVHLNALKKYTYGKHIVARVEKLVAAGERRINALSSSYAAQGE
ncbi:pumilio 1-like isoform X1 [Salvia divinorum]|uniref:Pumilio 1-like isoform X1 n=1 Tax=Salvia divinorum TaxID=28513 RepID=A0ABD1GNN0_SALDI